MDHDNPARVLDYELSDENPWYFEGRRVREMIEALLDEFEWLWPDGLRQRLSADRDRLTTDGSRPIGRPPKGIARLTIFAQDAPVYVAMDDRMSVGDSVTGDPTFGALAPARIALLYAWYDPHGPAVVHARLSIRRLSDVCRLWRQRHELRDRLEVEATGSQALNQYDWTAFVALLERLRTDEAFPEVFRRDLATLRKAASFVNDVAQQRLSEAFGRRCVTGLELLSRGEMVVESGGEDGDRTDTTLWVKEPPQVESLLQDAQPHQAAAIARHGASVRCRGRWGLASQDALTESEARQAYRLISRRLQDAEGIEAAAFALLQLALLTGHRPEALLGAVLDDPLLADVKPALRLEEADGRVSIRVPCIEHARFAKPPRGMHSNVSASFTLHLPVAPDLLRLLASAGQSVCGIDPMNSVQAILETVSQVSRDLRACVSRFTVLRARTALIQRALRIQMDLPLVQMLFCEPLEASTAGLHYYAVKEEQLQQVYDLALGSLYGVANRCHADPRQRRWVGAPLGPLAIDSLPVASGAVMNGYGDLVYRTSRLDAVVQSHNRLCDQTAWVLFLGTGHRGHGDFNRLTLSQISLAARVCVYSDKRNDPGNLRRLVALSDTVVQVLQRYVAHLERLRTVLSQSGDAADEVAGICNAIEGALEGSEALFFKCSTANARLETNAFDIRALWKQHMPDGMPANCARHAFATLLRQWGVPGVWIEAQLGHHFDIDIFGHEGLLSCIEFSELMNEAIERFLEACQVVIGIDRSGKKKSPVRLKAQRLSGDLGRRHRESVAEDRVLTRRLAGLDEEAQSGSLSGALDSVLREAVPGYDEANPPLDVSRSDEAVRELAKAFFAKIGTVAELGTAAALFMGRLRYHRERHRWRVGLPHRLYRYHTRALNVDAASLTAFDQMVALRSRIERRIAENGTRLDRVGVTAVVLVLWGHVCDEELLCEILNRAPEATWCDDGFVVPLGSDAERTASSHYVTGLAGVALMGYIEDPAAVVIEPRDLNQRIYDVLPSQIRPRARSRALEWLCELVRLGVRVELPGVLAAVVCGEITSRQLGPDRLQQWIAGQPASIQEDLGGAAVNDFRRRRLGRKPPTRAVEDTAYRQLCQVFESPANFWTIMGLTGGKIPKGTRKPSMIRALDAAIEQISDWPPLAWLLLLWTRDLCGEGANLRNGKGLKVSVIQEYLSTVKGVLYTALSGFNPMDLDAEMIESLVQEAIDARKDPQSVGRLFDRFWHEVSRHVVLPPIVLSYPGGSKKLQQSQIDAAVVLGPEAARIDEAFQRLQRSPDMAMQHSLRYEELEQIYRLMRRTGMRRNEALGLRPQDLIALADEDKESGRQWLVSLRPYQGRPLKTLAAERAMVIADPALTPSYGRARQFPSLSAGYHGSSAFTTLRAMLVAATGDDSARPHHLRHSKVTEDLAVAFGADDLMSRLIGVARTVSQIGHARLETSVSHYFHVGQWTAAKRYTDESITQDISRKCLARLSSSSNKPDAMKKRVSRWQATDRSTSFLSSLKSLIPLDRRWHSKRSEGSIDIHRLIEQARHRVDVRALVWVIHNLASGVSVETLLRSCPLTLEELSSLVSALLGVGHKCGWSPVPEGRVLEGLSDYDITHAEPGLAGYYPGYGRQLDDAVITAWRCDLAIDDVGNDLARLPALMFAFSFQSRSAEFRVDNWRCGETISAIFRKLSLPLRVTVHETEQGRASVALSLTAGKQPKRAMPTLRFFIFVLFVIAEYGRLSRIDAVDAAFIA